MPRLSKNFQLSEYTASATADANSITNEPTQEHLVALTALVNCLMQPIRDHWGRVLVTSGYRSPQLNALVGGSSSSQHAKGEAADFHVDGVSCLEVAQWIVESGLEWDQMILETKLDGSGKEVTEWIHASYSRFGDNRGEILSARVAPEGTQYVQGLTKEF